MAAGEYQPQAIVRRRTLQPLPVTALFWSVFAVNLELAVNQFVQLSGQAVHDAAVH